MAKKKKLRVLLVDGNNYVHRGWHALAPMKNSDGFPTQGIKGTLAILMADIKHTKPDRVIVVFDKSGKPTWRSIAYPEYKRSEARVKARDDNKEVFTQFAPIRKLIKAMGIRVLGKAGVEADDLIGTLAVTFERLGCEVLISSKDKDFASLVTESIKMLKATTRQIWGPAEIKKEFGVGPEQMVEYLMLLGDKVDNIPGITKCGPGTAKKWLQEYGSIQKLRQNVSKMTPSIKAHFKAGRDNFAWTRQLLQIKTDIPNKVTLENCAFAEPDMSKIKKICKEYELKETYRELKECLSKIKEISTKEEKKGKKLWD